MTLPHVDFAARPHSSTGGKGNEELKMERFGRLQQIPTNFLPFRFSFSYNVVGCGSTVNYLDILFLFRYMAATFCSSSGLWMQ